jgi:hypothetical protein
MKKFVIFIFLFYFSISFSQDISDLGKATITDIRNKHNYPPCQETINKVLRYCSEDGNMVAYTFENNILNGIIFCTVFMTKTIAENELVKAVNQFEKTTGITPNISNGKATFAVTKNMGVIYEVKQFNGSYYLFFQNLLY